MVTGAAIHDGVGATGVVAHHTSHHGTVRRRGLGTKEQPVRLKKVIELIAHHTRLHAHSAGLGIDTEDTVKVA